jgi:hypothetical protein
MKYIKTYESIENVSTPKIGDYVICDDIYYKNNQHFHFRYRQLNNFLKNNIGKIISLDGLYNDRFSVKYKNIPHQIKISYFTDNIRPFELEEIVHWSKNTKDLEMYITANKYNL